MSEAAKFRKIVEPYLQGACVDVGSQGAAVVPWAMSFDLPVSDFVRYGSVAHGPIHLRGYADHLPFCSGSMDAVFSSHLLEDFEDWTPLLAEWIRVLKPGGYLVIIMPEKNRWEEALKRGQPPNCAHKHEAGIGELTKAVSPFGMEVIRDGMADSDPLQYSLIFVAKKL